MISFKEIMKKVLTEAMSFRQLWSASDSARKKRSAHVKPKQMFASAEEGPDVWQFSYKSDPGWSTTGKRWHGYVRLMKEETINNQNIEIQDLDCMVDCDCPDYRYRFAYGNAKQGASNIGSNSWNKNNGAYPDVMGERVGLCKHLMSLVEFLGTKIEPVAPEPDDVPVAPAKPKSISTKSTIGTRKTMPSIPSPGNVGMAPEPTKEKPSYYSDTRSGDLMERKGTLFERISKFVKQNPQFTIPYYDEE